MLSSFLSDTPVDLWAAEVEENLVIDFTEAWNFAEENYYCERSVHTSLLFSKYITVYLPNSWRSVLAPGCLNGCTTFISTSEKSDGFRLIVTTAFPVYLLAVHIVPDFNSE